MKFDQRYSWRQHWNSAHVKTHNHVELMEFPVLNHDGPFICDFCGKIYERRFALIIHLIKFHRKAQMYCDLCPKSFNFLIQLERHLLCFHLNMKNVCDVCGFNASRGRNLLKHKQKHEPKTQCQICNKLVRNIQKHQSTHLNVTCKICSKSINGNLMKIHVTEFHKTFLCDMCPKSYNLKSKLRQHIQNTHLKNKLYVCDVCGFESAYKFALKDHKKIHEPKLKCPTCDKLVNNVKLHQRNAHPDKNKLYVCDVCGYTSAPKSAIKRHIKIHEPKVKCPICHKPVTNIKTHKSIAHPEKKKLYVCDVCGYTSALKSAIKRHIKIHEPKVKCLICHKLVSDVEEHKSRVHLTKNKLHVCDVCGSSFNRKFTLEDHKKIHKPKVKCPICHNLVSNLKKHKYSTHPAANELYICKVCGFKSGYKHHLKQHIKIHEPKVKCPICHKLVTDVKSHKLNVHPLENKLHVCNVCGLKSTKKPNLERHMKIHEPKVKCLICHKLVTNIKTHDVSVHPPINKCYVCDFCGLKLSNKRALLRHMKMHDPRVKCPICDKLVLDIKRHRLTIHPETNKRYVCDVCGYTCSRKYDSKNHKKIHEPKVKCPICHKLVIDIQSHKFRVHPAKNKRYVCDVCGYKSGHKHHLERHIKIHEPKVKCPICLKLVRDIKSHKLTKHSVKFAAKQ